MTIKIRSAIAGVALALSAVAAQAGNSGIAVTDVEGMERLQLEWRPFKEALEGATGDTFELFVVNSRTATAAALRGEPDLPCGIFKILARSGDLPNDMIMVGAHVPTEDALRVQAAIINNKESIIADITAHEDNDNYVGMDLVEIEDSAYRAQAWG